MKIYFLDHYDSFSYNVINWINIDYFKIKITYIAIDDYNMISLCLKEPYPLIISPGPKSPQEIPITIKIIKTLLGKVPILGICLGHQALCYSQGCNIIKSKNAWHGTCRTIKIIDKDILFEQMPNYIKVATYNSLIVDKKSLSSNIKILAQNKYGEIEAIKINTGQKWNAYGLQFHPDSFLTEYSKQIAINWLNYIKDFFN